ncbi:MAG: double-strand break repair protein AddB, partial [Acetobacteraceae bacterium]|nr:double-strand break repair protein AddB [Acetobacteraceae bacterium]
MDGPVGLGAVNLYTLPPGVPFLDELARWWLGQAGPDPLSVADGLILLPTRRAARALGEAFLRQAGGKPMLLPRIAALGALDEAPLALAGALDLPPAVDEAQRLAVLARLVMALDGAYGAPSTADGAWRLARELADLLDEAHWAEVDLGEKLPAAAEAGYAEHWARTINFLEIVTKAWPAWLEENGLMDGAARALALLDVQAATWDAEPPPYPVVVAGTTGGVSAVARLMRVVARLASGSVIL